MQPPGHLVDGLHIYCTGSGSPVVLEAGIAASSVGWTLVQRQIEPFARVCSYDRPGLGWSPLSPLPRTPEQFVRDLHRVVEHAGPPAVLVGHSFGGLLVRLYAAHHPANVAGLVLADPALLLEWAAPEEQRLATLRRGVALSRRGATLARIGFVKLSLSLLTGGARFLPKLFAKASSGGAAPVTERLVGEVRKLPPEVWPVIQRHWSRPDAFLSMADHLESLPAVARAVAESPLPPGMRTIVISGSHLAPEQVAEHRSIATVRHTVAERCAHWVHLDRPDLIAEAVQELIA